MATSNLLLKGVALAGVAYLGYQAYQQKMLPGQSDPAPSSESNSSASSSSKKSKAAPAKTGVKPTVPPSDFPLKRGSKNNYVKLLQKHLGLNDDGVFGPATEAALSLRYGKKQITTLAELNTMLSTATTVPVQPGTKPTVPATTTAFQKKLLAQQQAVFNAIWMKETISSKSVYSVRGIIDVDIITNTLSVMNDSYLKGFVAAYGRSFKGLLFQASAKRAGSLLSDLNQVSNFRQTVGFTNQLSRVKQLA